MCENPSRKERFDVLRDTLRSHNERFVRGVLGVTTALLVVIGWLLTTEPALKQFKSNTVLTIMCVSAILCLAYIYWSSITRVYRVNQDAYQKLRALAYLEEEYYEHDCLSRRYYVFGLAINVWNYILIAALILNAYWGFWIHGEG